MKSICKNIAFSPSNTCLLGSECICKANELWLKEGDETPSEEPNQDEIWEEVLVQIAVVNAYGGPEEVKEDLKSKYSITRK